LKNHSATAKHIINAAPFSSICSLFEAGFGYTTVVITNSLQCSICRFKINSTNRCTYCLLF